MNVPPVTSTAKASVEAKVKRGPESWSYIYMMAGLAIAIEGTILAMIRYVTFPWNLATYGVLIVITWQVFMSSPRLHNWLIGYKIREENTFR